MNSARPHPTHDLALIAAAAADDLTGAAVREAAELVAACAECAALHADLVAIAAATRALPDPVRPRSFTISAEQAARLRPSGWRRLAAVRIADYRIARPMAVACTTLGLAGLLLATLSSGPLGALSLGGAAAPADSGNESMRLEGEMSGDLGASGGPDVVYGQAGGEDPKDVTGSPAGGSSTPPEAAPGPSGEPDAGDDGGSPSPAAVTTGTPNQWLVVLSLSLLAGGLGVFVLARERDRSD